MIMNHLVIVESPAKAKTIQKFLGKEYKVMSSFGHIRDLSDKGLGIDFAHNYAPQYVVDDEKKKLVAELKKKLKKQTSSGWHRMKIVRGKPYRGICLRFWG